MESRNEEKSQRIKPVSDNEQLQKSRRCHKCVCSGRATSQKKIGGYWCGDCRAYFNAFTNTPLERNKVDARNWIYATYSLTISRKGISSLQLSKESVPSKETAWYVLHRLRLASVGISLKHCGEKLNWMRPILAELKNCIPSVPAPFLK